MKFSRKILAQLRWRSPKLIDQRGAPVNNGDYVFEVMTRHEVTAPSSVTNFSATARSCGFRTIGGCWRGAVQSSGLGQKNVSYAICKQHMQLTDMRHPSSVCVRMMKNAQVSLAIHRQNGGACSMDRQALRRCGLALPEQHLQNAQQPSVEPGRGEWIKTDSGHVRPTLELPARRDHRRAAVSCTARDFKARCAAARCARTSFNGTFPSSASCPARSPSAFCRSARARSAFPSCSNAMPFR